MEQMSLYAWAHAKVDDLSSAKVRRWRREAAACERRLRQIEAKRAKQEARNAKAGVEKEPA